MEVRAGTLLSPHGYRVSNGTRRNLNIPPAPGNVKCKIPLLGHFVRPPGKRKPAAAANQDVNHSQRIRHFDDLHLMDVFPARGGVTPGGDGVGQDKHPSAPSPGNGSSSGSQLML